MTTNTNKMKEGEIIHFLRNSPKGQLKYDMGWDENPQAVWRLVSDVQIAEEGYKLAVVERATRIFRASEQKAIYRNEISPAETSSGSGSRITLLETDAYSNNDRHNSYGCERNKSPKPRRKGYGIREDEYDDEEMEREFQMHRVTDSIDHVRNLLREYNKQLMLKAYERGYKLKQQKEEELNKKLSELVLKTPTIQKEEFLKKLAGPSPEEEAEIYAGIEAERLRVQTEVEALDRFYDSKLNKVKEEKAKVNAAAAAKAAAAKAAEERERQIKLQQQQAVELQEQKRLEEEERKKKEIADAEAYAKKAEAAERLSEKSAKQSTNSAVEEALEGYILNEDYKKYARYNDLIQSYESATRDIIAGSPNPNIKRLYFGASKCINTPLNAIAMADAQDIAMKTGHFINLIEGKPVVGSSDMSAPFNSAELPNGRAFVTRLLAFRFVKKAESERLLTEKEGFVPLATVALSLCKKFPDWAALIQAYFYKLCPFLVPFSLPKGNQTMQEYCNSLGYDLKGTDATLLNETIGRVKGYCSLYATMVRTFEKSGQFEFGDADATAFFTIGSVWEILTKTMKLQPQADITVTVIQTLLELLSDRLHKTYGKQFQKLMGVLISVYLPKIHAVSTDGSQSGVVRFQTFLEQQYRRSNIR